MNGKRSREALLEFLDYLAKKGLMNPATARARKAAVNNVLSILDDDESKDVTTLDIDHLFSRYANIAGANYKPESLSVYKSRVRGALEDFKNYLENPMTFRPSVQASARRSAERNKIVHTERDKPSEPRAHSVTPPLAAVSVLPIPIRSDLVVQIQGLPHDLTPQEANKIANVIRAMASTE